MPEFGPCRPMGKPRMCIRIRMNHSRSEDYRLYVAVFTESIRYVLAQQTVIS